MRVRGYLWKHFLIVMCPGSVKCTSTFPCKLFPFFDFRSSEIFRETSLVHFFMVILVWVTENLKSQNRISVLRRIYLIKPSGLAAVAFFKFQQTTAVFVNMVSSFEDVIVML